MSPLPDLLPILPFTRPASGSVTLPGSKSLTNRALLLAALCDRPVQLTGALFSDPAALDVPKPSDDGFVVRIDDGAPINAVPGCDRYVGRIVRDVHPELIQLKEQLT